MMNDSGYHDTGAIHHYTPNPSHFSYMEPNCGHEDTQFGDGSIQAIHNFGYVKLHTLSSSFLLINMLRTPLVSKSLLSIYQFTNDNNCYFVFYPPCFLVKD